MNISKEQLGHEVGAYADKAKKQGVEFVRTPNQLLTPSFALIKSVLKNEANVSKITVRPTEAIALRKAANARVMVGVKTKNRCVYLPAVVLSDANRSTVRFGCLFAAQDIRSDRTDDASKPLTAFQQILLAKIAAEHQPKVGEHAPNGKINAADIGHAVVAATLKDTVNIHSKVHQLVDSGALSERIASTGATDVQFLNGAVRQNKELVLELQQIAGLLIVENHQLPFPIADDLEASAGFTLAAQTSRGQVPDLSRNLASMAS